jgi:hypothetical protein
MPVIRQDCNYKKVSALLTLNGWGFNTWPELTWKVVLGTGGGLGE